MTITLNTNGLQLNGHTLPVYSGTVHYWRLERSEWPLILDQVQALGFGMIETYIPWSVHETSPGHFDWGRDDDRKDIEAFMRLCEERRLWLIVRPGPLINAELTDFGFPEWVLLDPEVQARTAVDSIHFDAAFGLHPPHQFPVPSYASEAFYRAVGGWFDAVCPILARHLAPHGCIVAVQSDNETCYLFHDQPYATDYSPASLDLYHRFLEERYGDVAALNAAYGTHVDAFGDARPPRDCEVQTRADVPRHLDWIRYKEYQITWSVARIAGMLRARGIQGVPIFHDVAYQYQTPLDITALEAHPDIDWVGINLYSNKEQYAGTVCRIRYLAGATRLPFVPEFGCGLWSHHPRVFTPEEHEFITLSALMHGLKAFNLYMLVERERWTGSPITRFGALRPDYARFYQQLTGFLQRYEFWTFERRPQVLVLYNYDLGRYAAMASTLNFAHVDLLDLPPELFEVDLDLGLKGQPLYENKNDIPDNWYGTLTRLFQARHVDYDLADTHASAATLARYPLVCVPCADFMDADAQHRLLDYVRSGGTLVIGPIVPDLDAMLRPVRILSEGLSSPGAVQVGQGHLIWLPTARIDDDLEPLLPRLEYGCDQPAVDLVLHSRDGRQLLFIANPTAQPMDVTVSFAGRRTFRAAWDEPRILTGDAAISLTLPAYTVRIWEIEHD